MQNSLVGIGIAALVGAAVGLAGAASGFGLFRAGIAGKKMVHATIYLDQVGGSCIITTAPQTIEAYKKETVEWTIVDRCGVTLENEVSLVFAAGDPLPSSCVKKGKKKIKCTVEPSAAFQSYKYSVQATGAVTEDPELEIVQ